MGISASHYTIVFYGSPNCAAAFAKSGDYCLATKARDVLFECAMIANYREIIVDICGHIQQIGKTKK